MEKSLLLLLSFALLLSGCASEATPKEGDVGSVAAARAGTSSITLQPSAFPYTAHYSVVEGSFQGTKTVWRSGSDARVDYLLDGSAISLFLLGGERYSCIWIGGKTDCYNVTGTGGPESLMPFLEGSLPDSQYYGDVAIGDEQGRCYAQSYGLSSRRSCFTGRGVLAFDEVNESGKQPRVEYATLIEYYAGAGNFTLPAFPKAAPS